MYIWSLYYGYMLILSFYVQFLIIVEFTSKAKTVNRPHFYVYCNIDMAFLWSCAFLSISC